MNFQVRRWRLVLRVLVLALIVAAVPLPSAAGQPDQPNARPGLKASIPAAVRATAAKAHGNVAKEQATGAQLQSKSFFKTPAGMAVVAIMGAGVGYAIYSASHDRIAKNQGR